MQPSTRDKLIAHFYQHDPESTGFISASDVLQILTAMGHENFYIGTVSKDIRRLNYLTPEKQTINQCQLQEYFTSFLTQSSHSIWKLKYDLLKYISETGYLRPQQGGAGPGAAPGAPHLLKSSGQDQAHVSVTIGQILPQYANEIVLKVEKKPAPQSKPFIKVRIECAHIEEAKKIEELVKVSYDSLIKVLREEEPELGEIFSSIHLNTAVIGQNFNVFITTSNQQLEQLVDMYSMFFNRLFDKGFEGEANITVKSNYNLNDFLKEEGHNQYGFLSNDLHVRVEGKAVGILEALRHFCLKEKAFGVHREDFWGAGLLHLECVDIDVEFDKGELASHNYEVKMQFINGLFECKVFLAKLLEANIKIEELLQHIKGKIFIEGKFSEWFFQLSVKIDGLHEFLSGDLQQIAQKFNHYDDDE